MISFRKTIGFRLLIVSFLLLTIPLLIDSIVVWSKRYNEKMREAKAYLKESALLRVLPMSALEPMHRDAFEVLAYFLNLDQDFPEKPTPSLTQKLIDLSKIGGFNDLTLVAVNDQGRYHVVASARKELIGQDVTDFFQEPNPFLFQEEYGSDVVTYTAFHETLEMYFVSAFGIRTKSGKPKGIIAAVMPAAQAAQELLAQDHVHYPINFAVILPNSIVIVATQENFRFQHFKPLSEADLEQFKAQQGIASLLPEKPLTITKPKKPGGFLEFRFDGKEYLGVLEQITESQYTLLAYADKEEVLTRPFKDFVGIYVSYLLILIVGTVIVFFITKRWMYSVQHLSKVMMQVEKGALDVRYHPDRWGSQINRLGLIFNDMLESLLLNKERAEKERIQREKLAKELELGKKAQQRLLTKHPQDLEDIEVVERYIPAIEVGGDFYDFFRKPNGQLILSIADASGKGVLACCFSLVARNILRTLAKAYDDVAEILYRGNNLFCADTGETGMFVTVQMGQYDYETQTLTYYSLGHNPAILCRKNGEVKWLDNRDIAMGVILKKEKVSPLQTQLEKGDVIVFYTDGVTEAHNIHNELFGEERLSELIVENRKRSARRIAEKIEEEVMRFVGAAKQHDDITLLVVRRHD